ncbi:hypothetical protein [Pararhodobacter sp.]|uniref:hypothetical protein n=1 Tax=Pararhodobacter sp. TaxID=2127056 RepID=UPI002FDE21C0
MPYQIDLEDRGQDLIRLTVNETTGEITDAGLCSHLYADGQHHVIVDDLVTDRIVNFRRAGTDATQSFHYPMTRLSLNGKVLAEVARSR